MLGPPSSRLIQILRDSRLTLLATASHFPSGEMAGQPKKTPDQSGSTACALPSRVTHTSSCLFPAARVAPVAYISVPVAETARSAEPKPPSRTPSIRAVGSPVTLIECSSNGTTINVLFVV